MSDSIKKLQINILKFLAKQPAPVNADDVIVNDFVKIEIRERLKYLYKEKMISAIDMTDTAGIEFHNISITEVGLKYLKENSFIGKVKQLVDFIFKHLVSVIKISH